MRDGLATYSAPAFIVDAHVKDYKAIDIPGAPAHSLQSAEQGLPTALQHHLLQLDRLCQWLKVLFATLWYRNVGSCLAGMLDLAKG